MVLLTSQRLRAQSEAGWSNEAVPVPTWCGLHRAAAMGDTYKMLTLHDSLDNQSTSAHDNVSLKTLLDQREEALAKCRALEQEKSMKLKEVERLATDRRMKLWGEIQYLREKADTYEEEIADLLRCEDSDGEELPPGPPSLSWVDGNYFGCLCTCIIIGNIVTMAAEARNPTMTAKFWIADQVFLCWYVFELTVKFVYFRRQLFLGPFSVVWWNWLDAGIVASGVADQWLQPLLLPHSDGHHGHAKFLRSLRVVRVLRVFRVLRVLKVVKVFLKMDFTWTEGAKFQSFIACVIMINAFSMGMELDYPSDVWKRIEDVLLAIYCFEMAVRLKRWGYHFFLHKTDWAWNNLDFVIVAGGVIDQWLIALIDMIRILVVGEEGERGENHIMKAVMPLMRLMRLLRVLRLARLAKFVGPLLKLMMGVLTAMQSMQWVLVLTLALLYASSITFTSLVGHGLIFEGEPPPEAERLLGTMPRSMFILFRAMTGNVALLDDLVGEGNWAFDFIFVVFVMLSSWVMVAILTAVVSENMISSTVQMDREQAQAEDELKRARSYDRLLQLFSEIDSDGNKTIDENEFKTMLQDSHRREELSEASGLKPRDLEDIFFFLSNEVEGGTRVIRYEDFIEKLQVEDKLLSERSLFRVEKKLRLVEETSTKSTNQMEKLDQRINAIEEKLGKILAVAAQQKPLPQHPRRSLHLTLLLSRATSARLNRIRSISLVILK